MGDRTNIGIVMYDAADDKPQGILWFYSHWGFDSPARIVAKCVENSMSRLYDVSYQNRIAISTLMEEIYSGSGHNDSHGSGISFNYIGDNQHSLFVIDFAGSRVFLYPEWRGNYANRPDPKYVMPLQSFLTKYGKVPA